MTGIAIAVSSGGQVLTNPLNALATNSAPGSGSSTATVTLSSDGTMSGSANYTGPANWISPAVSGIGSSYWVSFDGGAFLSLSGGQSTSITGGNATANRTVRIATDSGGSNIIATGTINLQVSNGA